MIESGSSRGAVEGEEENKRLTLSAILLGRDLQSHCCPSVLLALL